MVQRTEFLQQLLLARNRFSASLSYGHRWSSHKRRRRLVRFVGAARVQGSLSQFRINFETISRLRMSLQVFFKSFLKGQTSCDGRIDSWCAAGLLAF